MWIAAIPGLLLIVLPLAGLLWRAVTVRAWAGMAADGLGVAVWLSLYTTAAAIVITILLGTPLAYALSRDMFPYNRVVNLLVELPIVLPPAVAGLALLITFGRRGVLGDVGVSLPFTVYAVVLAQAFVAMPFYVRTAVVGFRNVPRILEDAARVDGADERAVFQRIVLPMAGRTLVAGAVLGWARAMGEFGATLIFAGSLRGRTQTMPLYIYSVLERDVDAAVWAGVLLLGVAFVALSVSRWLSG